MMMRGKKMMMRRGKIKERENESAVGEDSTFFFVFVPFRVCKLSTIILI